VLVFALGLVVFLLPGLGLARWLHRVDRFDLPTRLVLGLMWSFALFFVVAGPFLWLHGSIPAFLTVLGAVWIVLLAVAAAVCVRTRRQAPDETSFPVADKPATTRKRMSPPGWRIPITLCLYAALTGAILYEWKTDDVARREWITLTLPALLLPGAGLAIALLRSARETLEYDPEDLAPAPRPWSLLAALLILLQAAGAIAYSRPDWDDCYYLAAALDFQEGSVLNSEEPTFREGFPVEPIYWLMGWELWGATLGRLSGVGPLVTFHSLLPGLIVIACYGAYRSAFAELVPRRWVALALIGLSAFHLWGISNLGNASNHFLIRSWQGKALLLHFDLPVVLFALMRLAREPGPRWGLTLCAALTAGVGFSSSAIFLSTCFVACTVPALLSSVPIGKRVAFAAGSLAALLPLVGVGALTWLAIRGNSVYLPESGRSSWQAWFFEWDRYAGAGSAEIIWLSTLPLAYVLVRDSRSRALLVVLPIVLLLTFGNPLWQQSVAGRLTGGVTYYRLFWLYPVGLGLSVLLALLSRLAGRLAGNHLGTGATWPALAVCLAGVAVSAFLPGEFVWSERNSPNPYMVPGPSENLEAMPAELKVIASRLTAEPDIDTRRIACGEEVASFLTPYRRRFRFVGTRDGYTMYSVGRSRGAAEAAERMYLTAALQRGRVFEQLPDAGWDLIVRTAGPGAEARRPEPWPSWQSLPQSLARYDVGYVITSPILGRNPNENRLRIAVRDDGLRESGFRRVFKGEKYSLWKRADSGTATTQP
jgi:hypothetical protein